MVLLRPVSCVIVCYDIFSLFPHFRGICHSNFDLLYWPNSYFTVVARYGSTTRNIQFYISLISSSVYSAQFFFPTAKHQIRAWADYFGDLLIDVTRPWEYFPTGLLERLVEWRIFGEEVDYSFSLLSMLIIALNSWILLRGATDSARFNNIMTVLNIGVLMLVVFAGVFSGSISKDNLTPFIPHHSASVLQGAGLVFYAFIG